ncbi:MAG: PDZ domain-containing protein [Oscillospiraceae bacterium]|nr:PDZ domain-containing protein [Oscillospiraceae bacterium]
MDERNKGLIKLLLRIGSYILVAALATAMTLAYYTDGGLPTAQSGKLQELKKLIVDKYIGDVDETLLEDMAAAGMVAGTGDQWSYYIPADQLQEHKDVMANAYVGIGVTIRSEENEQGFEILQVEPGGPAKEGGILPGDVIVAVDGQSVVGKDVEATKSIVVGDIGTTVDITFVRQGREQTVTLTRQEIMVQVASGQMLTEDVGYIRIKNFDSRCAQETIALYEELEQQGAKAFVFDVRFNPGGYKDEMVQILDFLLPEGVLFRSENYLGFTAEDTSDASCKDVPMAVLINADSYSAAEFFAAALQEYDYAVTVGQATTGKGYFQNTFELSDGSAVNLSVGKYFTPNGVSLAEVGGLEPQIPVEVDEETAALIYGELLEIEQDVQIQAALEAVQKELS